MLDNQSISELNQEVLSVSKALQEATSNTCQLSPQIAYQKGVSCIDAIYATRETLFCHARDKVKPILCFYKAFESVGLPILLKEMYTCGINGKLCRPTKSHAMRVILTHFSAISCLNSSK